MRFILIVRCDVDNAQEGYKLESLLELPSFTGAQLAERLEVLIKDYVPSLTGLDVRFEEHTE